LGQVEGKKAGKHLGASKEKGDPWGRALIARSRGDFEWVTAEGVRTTQLRRGTNCGVKRYYLIHIVDLCF